MFGATAHSRLTKSLRAESAEQPALDHITTVLGFPVLENFVISALAFDDPAVVWTLVLLDQARKPWSLFRGRRRDCTPFRLLQL